MILLIDNYDSFSYNLYQLVCQVYLEKHQITPKDDELDQYVKVIRNDEMTVDEIRQMKPEAIILSPGPKKPSDAGICMDVVKEMAGEVPILGVCLGHQAICEAFHGVVGYAPELMHGKTSMVEVCNDSPIFKEMNQVIQIARYHSLIAYNDSMPECLRITARTRLGEIMAIEHKEYPIYGLQFHPESILTPDGKQMIKNFMEVITND